MTRGLRDRGDNFDDRNDLNLLALGALSLARRLDALLAAHAPEPGGDDEPDPHPWDDAALGLIALRARIIDLLVRLCPEVQACGERPAPSPSPRPRELLR